MSRLAAFAQKPELVVQTGHSQIVYGVAFSPDGKRLVTGGFDSNIKFWDVDTGEEIRTLNAPGPVHAIAFSPNGKFLASGGEDGAIILWNGETGEEVRRFSQHSKDVKSLAFGPPDGELLATGSEDGKVELWRVRLVSGYALFWHGPVVLSVLPLVLMANFSAALDLALSDIWDVSTGKEVHKLEGHAG